MTHDEVNMLSVKVRLSDDTQVMVRIWTDGNVEVDSKGEEGHSRSVWTPVQIIGGTFSIHASSDHGTQDLEGSQFPFLVLPNR